jgi:hypothetical protein
VGGREEGKGGREDGRWEWRKGGWKGGREKGRKGGRRERVHTVLTGKLESEGEVERINCR